MRHDQSIGKVLVETPVPRVQDGPHRATLKRELLAQMRAGEARERGTRARRFAPLPWLAAAAAVVVVAVAAAVFVARRAADRAAIARAGSTRVASTASPGATAGAAAASQPATKRAAVERGGLVEREGLRGSLNDSVGEAPVIVVATALDSAVAPPKRPGDAQENLIRFKVKRVLKGEWDREIITYRTPTGAAEFINKDWIILLPADYVAGKHLYAHAVNIQFEAQVKAVVAGGPKK